MFSRIQSRHIHSISSIIKKVWQWVLLECNDREKRIPHITQSVWPHFSLTYNDNVDAFCTCVHAWLSHDCTQMSKWIVASFVRFLALAGYNPFIIAKLSGDRMLLRHIEDGIIGFIPVVFLVLSAKPLAFIDQSAKTLLSFDYTRYKDFWKDLLSCPFINLHQSWRELWKIIYPRYKKQDELRM